MTTSGSIRGGLLRAAAALALLAGCTRTPSAYQGPKPRAVLLISIDSLRADHLSCYGYRSATRPELATSPTLDARLAGEGARFTNAVSTTSWTVPAHKALLSGLPDVLQCAPNLTPLPTSRQLLAERFLAAGWRTAGFFSGPNLHPWYGFGRGFEHYQDCSNAAPADDSTFDLSTPEQRERMSQLQRASHQGVTGPKVVSAFDTWLAGVRSDQPFFAFLHFWDVHFDYAAPPEFDQFDPQYAGTLDGQNYIRLANQTERPPEDVARLLSLYDAEVRFTDHSIAQVLERLAEAGRLDDTLVIVVSDHGEEFFEHGHFGHNRTLFEEVVHIPVLVRFPAAIRAGTTSDSLVCLADVAPTILDMCGLADAANSPMWGQSFADLLSPGSAAPFEERPTPLDMRLFREDNPLIGMRAPRSKVVQAPADREQPLAQRFDLARDGAEQAGEVEGPAASPDAARDFRGARGLWNTLDARAHAMGCQRSDAVMPAELLKQLTGLGYASADATTDANSPPRDPSEPRKP